MVAHYIVEIIDQYANEIKKSNKKADENNLFWPKNTCLPGQEALRWRNVLTNLWKVCKDRAAQLSWGRSSASCVPSREKMAPTDFSDRGFEVGLTRNWRSPLDTLK